jgi:hypothetical protein
MYKSHVYPTKKICAYTLGRKSRKEKKNEAEKGKRPKNTRSGAPLKRKFTTSSFFLLAAWSGATISSTIESSHSTRRMYASLGLMGVCAGETAAVSREELAVCFGSAD